MGPFICGGVQNKATRYGKLFKSEYNTEEHKTFSSHFMLTRPGMRRPHSQRAIKLEIINFESRPYSCEEFLIKIDYLLSIAVTISNKCCKSHSWWYIFWEVSNSAFLWSHPLTEVFGIPNQLSYKPWTITFLILFIFGR